MKHLYKLLAFFTVTFSTTLVSAQYNWNVTSFGPSANTEISSIQVFNDTLYATTGYMEPKLYFLDPATQNTWIEESDPVFPVVDLSNFEAGQFISLDTVNRNGGYLFAGFQSWNINHPSGVFRKHNGIWENISPGGLPNYQNLKRVFHFTTPTNETKVVAFTDTNLFNINYDATSFAWTSMIETMNLVNVFDNLADVTVFNNELFLSLENFDWNTNERSGVGVYRSTDLINWSKDLTIGDDFGDTNNTSIKNFCVFNNELYAFTKNKENGTQVWKTPDGQSWSLAVTNGLGLDSVFYEPTAVSVADNKIWVVGLIPNGTDMAPVVLTSTDGINFTTIDSTAFLNTSTNGSTARMAQHDDKIYLGLGAPDGADVFTAEIPQPLNVSSETPNKNKIYPNPTKGLTRLNLDVPANEETEVTLSDMTGKLIHVVFSGKSQVSNLSLMIDTRELNLQEGIYLVRLNSRTNNSVSKLIVAK